MSDVQAETIVEPTEPVEPAPTEPEVKQPDTSWVPKRISEITAARRAAEARAEAAEAELARLRNNPAPTETTTTQPTNQSVEQLAKAYAERMVREQREQDTLTGKIAAVNQAGAKEFGDDYEKSVQNLNMAGIGGPDFLRVVTSVSGAEKLVTWLGKPENLNEAMRVATMDPVQMAIEMSELSRKAAKALSKPISKVPPPVDTVDGNSSGSDASEPDPKDTKKWMEWRARTRKSRR